MNDIGKKIKEARLAQKLTIKELSDKTKIRAYVIEAIEREDYSVMPDVYLKSFIKHLTQFLKIKYTEPITELKKEPEKKKKFDDEAIYLDEKKSNIVKVKKTNLKDNFKANLKENFSSTLSTAKHNLKSKEEKSNNHFAELFRKSKIDIDKRYVYLNRVVYTVFVIAVIVAIYFGFSSLTKDSNGSHNDEILNKTDTVSLEEKTNNLFSYFEKPDSLKLTAKAHDTIWIRVLSDGKFINEALLKPGMEESWLAKEYFLVDLGNVGGADIYRNEELLPQFGRKGSVVKNIKITATEVLNTYAPKPDSLSANNGYKKKEKDKNDNNPKIIELSPIQTSPQFQLMNRDSTK